ncbi:MAG: hypothetical protein NT069_09045 [Planctomycetota bacterium]|nr:hypothetical protein [Planctomycetota bacterium]
MAEAEPAVEVENRHHRYVARTIPWYIHATWVVFWVFVIYYVVTWLIPALQSEIAKPG